MKLKCKQVHSIFLLPTACTALGDETNEPITDRIGLYDDIITSNNQCNDAIMTVCTTIVFMLYYLSLHDARIEEANQVNFLM